MAWTSRDGRGQTVQSRRALLRNKGGIRIHTPRLGLHGPGWKPQPERPGDPQAVLAGKLSAPIQAAVARLAMTVRVCSKLNKQKDSREEQIKETSSKN